MRAERSRSMKVDLGVAPNGAPDSVAGRIATIRASIADAASRAGRDPNAISLVAVTKRRSREDVVAAIGAGITEIAESYVQEARPKYADLAGARKHFIGHVQTNKASAIVATFDVVQSIDRLDAGRAIAKAARNAGRRMTALLQVNISPTDRFGIAPDEAPALAATLRDEGGLEIDGIMAIAPNTGDRGEVERAFERAARAFGAVGGTTLSIGMSGDWKEAIGCGSTMLRIGTAIFGARE